MHVFFYLPVVGWRSRVTSRATFGWGLPSIDPEAPTAMANRVQTRAGGLAFLGRGPKGSHATGKRPFGIQLAGCLTGYGAP